jgi:uncharacterized protein (TIGR02646 family)
MRTITKGAQPPSLTAHQRTDHCDYDNYAGKDDLRYSLVTEQQALCCYCMGRIRNDPTTMKIEHWHSQKHYPEEQLAYPNLLGACRGGEGRPVNDQHCDTRKGDRNLLWNPAETDHHVETRIRYELDGSIHADDPVFEGQLTAVLNLNYAYIKNNRRSVLTALLEWWKAKQPVAKERIEREIADRTTRSGDLVPYCQVAIWWLKQRLARMA